jgi:eukaryotic-like serine/threonine-protein kinase
VFGRMNGQSDVYIGDLTRGGTHLKALPRRLTLSERNDWPVAWTSDGKSVFFTSDRSGKWGIYKQALEQDSAEAFVTTPQEAVWPQPSPDDAWIIYESDKPGDAGTSLAEEVRRVPMSGGPSQLVLTAHGGFVLHKCGRFPASLCLVAERTQDRKQLVFTAFDPLKGRGQELTRIATDPRFQYYWDLSPNGTEIAVAFPAGENRIRLLRLTGGAPRDLIIKGWFGFDRPFWSPDGKGFYVSSSSPRGVTLLHIDLKGSVNPLWEQKGSFLTRGVPSPDGRHLAIMGWTIDSNVWMLENF